MARIRTIKPSFFTSTSVTQLPIQTRLTFIGLWTYVDDAGRGVDDSRLVRAAIWPLDDRKTPSSVNKDLETLVKRGFIERYRIDGESYLRVRNWSTHQRINRPQPSRIPCSEEERLSGNHGGFTESSVNDHGSSSADSVNDHGGVTEPSVLEGKGREGNKERKSSSSRSDSRQRAQRCDDDPRIRTAIELIADQRIARLTTPPDDLGRYRTSVLANVRRDVGADIAAHAAARLEATPHDLASRAEPPTPPRQPRPADPLEQSARAQRDRDERLARRQRGEACPTCDDLGVVEQPDGSYEPCPTCT